MHPRNTVAMGTWVQRGAGLVAAGALATEILLGLGDTGAIGSHSLHQDPQHLGVTPE